EGDLLGALMDACHVEQGLQRHAAPARIPHRAVAQLAAGNPRAEKSAAVAGALIDGHKLDRLQSLDLLERQFQWVIDLALDLDSELVRIDVERDAGEVI